MDKSKEEFEAWILSIIPAADLEKKDGRYIYGIHQFRWEAWQASRKALVVTLPDKIYEEDEFDKGHNCAIDYCAEAIRVAGITVKGGE